MDKTRPAALPANPRFSSGPAAKPPSFDPARLGDAPLGRSHRSAQGRARLRAAIDGTREILEIPDSHRIGIVPASDTGAVEMAMWSLLGPRRVEVLAWESFGAGWAADATQQLRLDAVVRTAEYGRLPDLGAVDPESDVVFAWNGTTSGVRVPDADWISPQRGGLAICDATSAAFAQRLPWDRLDAATFSWQKVLGGEAAHGMLILGPRAVERIETHVPAWPMPKIFRLAKDGRLNEGVFRGDTINTPSMLAVQDYLHCLEWARSAGGLDGLCARADASAGVIAAFVESRGWIDFVAEDPATRSNTSVCLKFTDPLVAGGIDFARAVAARLEEAGAALDIGAHRDAPAGLRIWCGATVETSDVAALMPWIDWAYAAEFEIAAAAARLGDVK